MHCKALVDTGSTFNLINSRYIKERVLHTDIKLKAANGTDIKVKGTTTALIRIGDREYTERFIVTDIITSDVILGYEFCRREKVSIDFRETG